MSNVDQLINIIVISSIAAFIAVWIAGAVKRKLLFYFSVLNAVSGLAIIAYWIQNELRITQHTIETREIAVLTLEALFVAVSIYSISAIRFQYTLKIIQYIIFGLHFSSLILFLIFMLTFKINRLM